MFNPYQSFTPYNQPYSPQNFQANNYQPQTQNTQSTDERIFVANSAAADAYLVTAGGFVRLWDSSKPLFYEKQADMSGRQFPMRVFEYHEMQKEEPPQIDYEARFRAIEERLAAFEERKSGRAKKEVNNEQTEC